MIAAVEARSQMRVTYQPASRYWGFQWLEIYLVWQRA